MKHADAGFGFATLSALREIARTHGCTLDDLRAPGTRRKREVRARWACFAYLAARGFSTPHIGGFFGRDHTTVIHGLNRRLQEQAPSMEAQP